MKARNLDLRKLCQRGLLSKMYSYPRDVRWILSRLMKEERVTKRKKVSRDYAFEEVKKVRNSVGQVKTLNFERGSVLVWAGKVKSF